MDVLRVEIRLVKPIDSYDSHRTANGSSVTGTAGGHYCRLRVFFLHGISFVARQTGGGMVSGVVGGIVDLHAPAADANVHHSLWQLHPPGDEQRSESIVSPSGFIADFWRGLPGSGCHCLHCACQFSVEPVP